MSDAESDGVSVAEGTVVSEGDGEAVGVQLKVGLTVVEIEAVGLTVGVMVVVGQGESQLKIRIRFPCWSATKSLPPAWWKLIQPLNWLALGLVEGSPKPG